MSASVVLDDPDSSSDEIADAIARITFSGLTEPGDQFAGWLMQNLEPRKVLQAVIDDFALGKLLRSESEYLQQRFGDVGQLISDSRSRWQPRLSLQAVEAAIRAARQLGARVMLPKSEHWPIVLDDLADARPHCLWLRGNPRVVKLAERSISLVGSRMATDYGHQVTVEIASHATEAGLAVVSGGAYGIDAVAHRSALALDGFTIAVLAGGVDRMYPSGNAELLKQITKDNAVISEQIIGTTPTKWRFLQRNRLIAALGRATVVVEAGFRSGALNTANHALSLDRPLGVIPGRIDSPQSQGCLRLIRAAKGQVLLSSMEAVDLALGRNSEDPPGESGLGGLQQRILDALGARERSEATIGKTAGVTATELATALGSLSLLGLVARRAGGWVKLR